MLLRKIPNKSSNLEKSPAWIFNKVLQRTCRSFMLLLDSSAAHEILFSRLESRFGISGPVLNWAEHRRFASTKEEVGGLGKVRVKCFPKAIATWHGRESNPRPPDLESDALTTPPRCPCHVDLFVHDLNSDKSMTIASRR
ncbi:hypothetical protein ElyMa_000556600 [Elysia marginata]|uniref:Uncharacterized protein n=1 Tax=Elysia marginata TaxID=1093978 RepID=A0AAV4G4H9_9GAST|nr:hypothetical protein ElyMa_000556600 [Elysia marginata]